MKVYLLRHTAAAYGTADAQRPLTEAGHRMAAGLAEFVNTRPYFRIGEIWCSTHLRARQTAEPFLEKNGKRRSIHYSDDLLPEADPDRLVEKLKRLKKPVLVVGHNPHLTRVARRLLGFSHANSAFTFKKGTLMVFKTVADSTTGFQLAACLPPGSIGLAE